MAFTTPFDRYVCPGDQIVTTDGPFEIVAHIVHDEYTRPEDCDGAYDDHQLAAWHNDAWFFCGIVLDVLLDGIPVAPHAAAIWGLEANLNGDNAYLTEVANELLPEALDEAKATAKKLIAKLAA